MRQKLLATFCILFVAAIFSGCLEVTETYTLNPDGSGKLMLKSAMKPFDFDDEKSAKEKKEELREFVASVLEKSSGVDVWKDISVKHLPDGKIYFEGTAYFPDLSALDIYQASMSEFALRKAEGGEMVIEIGKEEDPEETDTSSGPLNLTEEEIATKIDSAKEEFRMARGMLGMFLDDWNSRTTVRTAGNIDVAHGFTRNADGSITMEFRGKRVLEIIDSLTASDQYWRDDALQNTAGKMDRDKEMRAIMFGAEKPLITVSGASKPLFDYASEAGAAKKKYAALRKKYGL
jgi:hypothetical protein